MTGGTPRGRGRPAPPLDRLSEDFRIRECPRCRRTVLRGISDGVDTRIELRQLDAAGEVGQVLAGVNTYDVRVGSARAEVVRRSAATIQGASLLGRVPDLIMPEHRCSRREEA